MGPDPSATRFSVPVHGSSSRLGELAVLLRRPTLALKHLDNLELFLANIIVASDGGGIDVSHGCLGGRLTEIVTVARAESGN